MRTIAPMTGNETEFLSSMGDVVDPDCVVAVMLAGGEIASSFPAVSSAYSSGHRLAQSFRLYFSASQKHDLQ